MFRMGNAYIYTHTLGEEKKCKVVEFIGEHVERGSVAEHRYKNLKVFLEIHFVLMIVNVLIIIFPGEKPGKWVNNCDFRFM